MNLETEWRGLCHAADLHLQSVIGLLPAGMKPSMNRLVNRFQEQPVPQTQAELAARSHQETVVSQLVTAIMDLGVNGGAVEAAARLAELDLNQPDNLKFELEIEWILQRARR